MISAIIIDDEETGRENLATLISKYCSQINIVAMAGNLEVARESIALLNPDVIFLDIRLSKESGFDLLKDFESAEKHPLVIFVTAFDGYAISAIKQGAFDYILKPIDIEELQLCEKKLLKKVLPILPSQENNDKPNEVLTIVHGRGIKIIKLKEIIYLKANDSYTDIFYLENDVQKEFLASKTLGDLETELPGKQFFRVHKSYIINVDQVKEIHGATSKTILMANGQSIELARRKKSAFRKFLRGLNHRSN